MKITRIITIAALALFSLDTAKVNAEDLTAAPAASVIQIRLPPPPPRPPNPFRRHKRYRRHRKTTHFRLPRPHLPPRPPLPPRP